MPNSRIVSTENEQIDIDLRNPYLAGFLAWLVPGLGHYYQRRYAKALIFFLCIVPTFVVGCALASSSEAGVARNVYWSWRSGDMRFWWLAQAPLGLAAVPSWIQARPAPMFGKFMAPPRLHRGDTSGVSPVMDEIRQKMPFYELGTYLTVFASLMNFLVIFDAVDGPFAGRRKEEKTE
ncbi:MAG: hypothetical protein LBI05_02920 [Planctomycetaceae bacterium]|nr:hypothetical protein [Planctomycetaceae bacterium]